MAAVYKAAEAKRAAIEAERKAQRELVEAQVEAERASIEAERIAKLAAIEAEKVKKFERQKDLAEQGDALAMQHLGEFYRDGYGVKKDTAKATEYFAKSEETLEAEAQRIAKETALKELALQKQKFLKNLELADKRDNGASALYVEKCYREGIGVEKDLTKAEAYHTKAVSLGVLERPNTSKY
jgi:TPR repeat protein